MFLCCFSLGAGLNLGDVWKAGVLGVLMGVAVVIVTGLALMATDRDRRERSGRLGRGYDGG